MASDERLRELEEKYEGFTVYDNAGEKIGKVDDLFVDETDREEYIGVKMGLFGLSGTTLIPMDMVRVDERERRIEVSETKERVKDAPTYSDDDEVNTDFEERIRSHFGMQSAQSSGERGTYGRYSGATMGGAEDSDRMDQDRMGQESYRNREDMGSESSMGTAGAGGTSASGGIPDLETGERRHGADRGDIERGGRDRGDLDRGDLDRDGEEMGGMTRGHREGGDRGDLGSSGQGMTQGDIGGESAQGDEGYNEGYREGLREGFREGLREAGTPGEHGERSASDQGRMEDEGYRESGGRSELDDRDDFGSSGAMRGSESAEGGTP
ncbi:MAG: PRC-barrel domain-containing protein, partial [Actinobacteria bacterium]|nr:PRC-barrel domain-containing protein [Actinomycetota bacterium]